LSIKLEVSLGICSKCMLCFLASSNIVSSNLIKSAWTL